MTKTPTYFMSRCPVCGRTLQIPLQLFGNLLACDHCKATFVAQDRSEGISIASDISEELICRTELILSVVRIQRTRNQDFRESAEEPTNGVSRHRQAVDTLITNKQRSTRTESLAVPHPTEHSIRRPNPPQRQ